MKQETTNLGRIVENETGEEEDTEDDDGAGDERDICSVTHVRFLFDKVVKCDPRVCD